MTIDFAIGELCDFGNSFIKNKHMKHVMKKKIQAGFHKAITFHFMWIASRNMEEVMKELIDFGAGKFNSLTNEVIYDLTELQLTQTENVESVMDYLYSDTELLN